MERIRPQIRTTRRITLALLCAVAAFAAFYLLVSTGAGQKQIGVLAQYEDERPGKGCGDKNHTHVGGAPPAHSNGQGQGNQGKDPDETDCKKPPK